MCSTSTADVSSRGDTPTQRRRRRRGRKSAPARCGVEYRYSARAREDHGRPLFGVQFNPRLRSCGGRAVATCGGPRLSVYELTDNSLKLVQCYSDPDPDENFYTCAWSYDVTSGKPLLAAAGARGLIRIIITATMTCTRHLIGRGHAVTEVKFHPQRPALLLSVSKDHTLRLWNVSAGACVAVLGGVDGHWDEALSADVDLPGDQVISCGMDHSLKLWDLSEPEVVEAIEASYYARAEPGREDRRGALTRVLHPGHPQGLCGLCALVRQVCTLQVV